MTQTRPSVETGGHGPELRPRLGPTAEDNLRFEHYGESLQRRYLLLRELGRGGMGHVHLALDRKLPRYVALKLQHSHRGQDTREALQREAFALARVHDPHVVSIYDYGSEGESFYLAMEYLAGSTLLAWQEQNRSTRDLLRIYIAAGRGLLAVHRAGLIHRDFKPQNVLVGRNGGVKLIDLGLATPTPAPAGADTLGQSLKTPGTPLFIAPEQLLGHRVDERADQFSFCVALYRALYGPHPFAPCADQADPTTSAELNALLDQLIVPCARPRPPRDHFDGPLWRALKRGLKADAEARYPSMRELLAALEESGPRPSRRPVHRGRLHKPAQLARIAQPAQPAGP